MSALPHYTGPHGAHRRDSLYYRDPSLEEFGQDLARVNHFRADEVESNRHGFMSTPQFFRLLWQASQPLRVALVSLCAWLGLLLFVSSIFRLRLMRFVFFQNFAIELVSVTISLAMSLLAALVSTTEKKRGLLEDLIKGEVTSVEGRLHPSWGEEMGEGLKKVKREMVPYYRYTVRQEVFDVTPQAYDLLLSKYDDFRPVVRIYFTPRSRMLLSIEPVTVDPARYQESR